MEFVFMTRGHIDNTEKLIRNLRSVWFDYPMTFPGEEGKREMMEMNVKPLQLWDIAFPKEYKDLVLNTLIGTDREQHDKDMKKRYGFLWTIVKKLNKLMGLHPLPLDSKHNKVLRGVCKDNVEIFPVGIKEDGTFIDDDGKEVEGI